jgi:hypothetical protein
MANVRSRDKLMFEAGRVSAGHVHLWQGVSGLCALLLVCSLIIRSTPPPPESKMTLPQLALNQPRMPQESPMQRSMDAQAYIHVRHRVLEQGLDALPSARGGRAVAADRMRYGDALKQYMNM